MGDPSTVASAFAYPSPETLEKLRHSVALIEDDRVRKELEAFLHHIEGLSLGEWEELHTRTLDLSPEVVVYVGHVMWGENYRRGAFMAELMAAMREAGTDLGGELPDHLAPVLRLIDGGGPRPPDLDAVLADAVGRMESELRGNDPHNPYLYLLAAARTVALSTNGVTTS